MTQTLKENQKMIEGIGASHGIAIGHAYVRVKNHSKEATVAKTDDAEGEIQKFRHAVNRSIDEVESLIRKSRMTMTDEERDILEMQVEMLSDPQLHADVVALINNENSTAQAAVSTVCDQLIVLLGELDSDYLRGRASDVRACSEQIIRNIRGESLSLTDIPAGSVLVADDITPLEALSLDLTNVSGIVTRFGGRTSHTAILARARNIPAVVGCGDGLSIILQGEMLIADGSEGHVCARPSDETMQAFVMRRRAFDQERKELLSQTTGVAKTIDGREVRLQANISGPQDMSDALALGATGVGLFRTELLFMSHGNFPTEDEQFGYYRKVVEEANGHPVTIRTLDIGGDKPLPYFDLPREENPFLGYRAIRISLREPDRFLEQLRAILRASAYGKVRIMFPMIVGLQELRQCKSLLHEARHQLLSQGVAFDAQMPVGVMIETPAAAIMADRLAREVEFFSIGTNDLCQYTLAVDRGNKIVTSLYEPLHPSMLRLIGNIIDQAALHKIDVSVCGELAGDPRATLLLIGMGLGSFSMSASSIPVVKRAIIQGTHMRALQIASDVLDMNDTDQINEYLTEEALNRNI
ncbi:phosphoenolpyruvate--protein phosphotransferase [Chryseolinea sp. T2]|uniref:phosphoenolpyruvate--protein phosphotransferase n=1 Tax=Chryseolinea sp. T2 TaxID=3129255 RepID=UPI00307697BD